MTGYDYIRDPAAIYEASFSMIEAEASLAGLPPAMRKIAVRLIHACGMVDIVDDLAFSPGAAEAGLVALRKGAPVYCDAEMVRHGIIRRMLPADNRLHCTLNDPETPARAAAISNTRSAAAVDAWNALAGAVVVIGNAPTALFRLLERVAAEGCKPALIVGIPVGFVGAVESKQALADNDLGLEFITVHGRRGGSAMAAGVVNALCGLVRDNG